MRENFRNFHTAGKQNIWSSVSHNWFDEKNEIMNFQIFSPGVCEKTMIWRKNSIKSVLLTGHIRSMIFSSGNPKPCLSKRNEIHCFLWAYFKFSRTIFTASAMICRFVYIIVLMWRNFSGALSTQPRSINHDLFDENFFFKAKYFRF